MLEHQFEKLYFIFRSNYFKRMVESGAVGKHGLTTIERHCVEVIYLLDKPTISRFARYLNISVPNANYKIKGLVRKGYVERVPSLEDHRETLLRVTDKFLSNYGLHNQDNARLMQRIRETFTAEEVASLESTIGRVLELMVDGTGT